ncbi:MAG: ribosomal-protein-alanine N-acetyltransferase [Polaribacter sp.]|jgi:ribosomal-protein-alanine N-acetyltransferase
MENTQLKTDRIYLRKIVSEDLPAVFKGLSHPEVIKYYGISFKTLEETKEQMDWFANLEKTGTGTWWAICSNNDNRFLGAGGFNDLNKDSRKAEVGLWLLPEHWGNGYLREAMPLMVNYAFQELGLHRIEGFVESSNENCKRAMSKVNFTHEGTMRDCEMKDGKLISLDIFAQLSTDGE